MLPDFASINAGDRLFLIGKRLEKIVKFGIRPERRRRDELYFNQGRIQHVQFAGQKRAVASIDIGRAIWLHRSGTEVEHRAVEDIFRDLDVCH